MKFDLGAQTQTTPARKAEDAGDDLGGLIMDLIAAVEPLKEEFSGAGRAAFDSFTSDADAITADLDSSLAAILGGRSGTTTWLDQDDTGSADTVHSGQGSADADAAPRRPPLNRESLMLDRPGVDTAASQQAQSDLAGAVARLEAAIAQRNADVNAAMNDFSADGVAEHYRAMEQRWHSAATQVQQIITLLRATITSADDTATTALPQARAAVQDIA